MGKKHLHILSFVFAFGCINALAAKESKNLSLSEAINLGIENSKQLKVSISKSNQAHFSTNELKSNRLSEVNMSGEVLGINKPNIMLGDALSGSATGSGGNASPSSGIAPNHLMFGMVTAQVPLFSGLKIQNGIRSSQYLETAAQLDVEAQKSEVILNLVNAYVDLYKSQEAVKLVEEDLRESQKRVKDFTRMNENGILALNDLLKAQLNESNTSLALLNVENNHRVANHNMDLLLGLEENTVLMLDSVNIDQLAELYSVTDLKQTAIVERKDLQALTERQKASESAIKVAKGDYWPSIGITGGYVAADIDKVATITNAVDVGVGVSFNLSKLYKNGSSVNKAKEQLIQTQLMHDQLTDKVKSEVYHSFSDYQESMERMVVYEKAEKQAKENYRITKDKHENSLATTTDLLDADIDQLKAVLNLRFSKVDVMLAYCKLLQVTGQLNEQSIEILNVN